MLSLARNRTALILIDLQTGFDAIAATGLHRNNPGAERNIALLIEAFRKAHMPVIHIRHASLEPESPFRPERSGFAVMDWARETGAELVLVKHVNSAFIGTDLEALLRREGLDTLVIAGATTNHCVETTTRMAGNLGFRALLARDGTWTFDRMGPDGERHRAEDIHQMTLSNLAGEFAEIVRTKGVLAALAAHESAILEMSA
jgi:nicotinamidase-related amidase